MKEENSLFLRLIREAFADFIAATEQKYQDYDVFKDHRESSHRPGKSYFLDNPDDGTYLTPDGIEIIEEVNPTPAVRILTIGFTAEYFDPDEGGLAGFMPEKGYKWQGYPVGKHVCTEQKEEWATPELKVRFNHGEFQFHGRESDWKIVEQPTDTATVILEKEGDEWLFSTAFPGPASPHNDKEVMKKYSEMEYLDTGMLEDGAEDTSHTILLSDEEFDKL